MGAEAISSDTVVTGQEVIVTYTFAGIITTVTTLITLTRCVG